MLHFLAMQTKLFQKALSVDDSILGVDGDD